MSFVKRFYIYQKERFPFAVLIFTTLAVVLSSAAVSQGNSLDILRDWKAITIGTITCLFFMFSIRVFDDHKDRHFDDTFYKKRPIQRGLIELSELNRMNFISILILGILNLIYSTYSFVFLIAAFSYSLLAKKEFFMKEYLRKRFILYNLLNLFQILLLQVYLYSLLFPGFNLTNPLLSVHFIFVLVNAAILEVARKMKSSEDESKGKDTYSGRYGILKASVIYLVICLISFSLFLFMLFKLHYSINILMISIFSVCLVMTSIIIYFINRNKISSDILQGIAILFYLSMHLLLVGALI